VPPKLFDYANRSKRRVNPEAHTVRRACDNGALFR
jgi:hypothetical protein